MADMSWMGQSHAEKRRATCAPPWNQPARDHAHRTHSRRVPRL